MLVVAIIAVAIYFTVRIIDNRGLPRGPFRTPPRPSGPIGPDDDPDFIWGLNKKKRHPGED